MIAIIEKRLAEIKQEEKLLLEQLDKKRSLKRFQCDHCNSTHAIKDCDVIQSHWYERPYGCTGGDNWWEGELQIICPVTDKKSRVLFNIPYDLTYDKRNEYQYSAEKQFKRLYKHLFKSVIKDYKEDQRPWSNSFYFDNNRKRFGLCIKGVDDKVK